MERDFNALCCKCGAALKYPVELVYRNRKTGEIVKTETWGRDCFETAFGDGSKFLRNGQFDVEEYEANKQAKAEAAAAANAEYEARKATYADRNAWLIEELKPFGMENTYDQWKGVQYTGKLLDNFAGSIINSLQTGELAVDLPERAKSIIADMVAKNQGRRNSKAYDAKHEEIMNNLYPETEN